jgi:hypothetical protein
MTFRIDDEMLIATDTPLRPAPLAKGPPIWLRGDLVAFPSYVGLATGYGENRWRFARVREDRIANPSQPAVLCRLEDPGIFEELNVEQWGMVLVEFRP